MTVARQNIFVMIARGVVFLAILPLAMLALLILGPLYLLAKIVAPMRHSLRRKGVQQESQTLYPLW